MTKPLFFLYWYRILRAVVRQIVVHHVNRISFSLAEVFRFGIVWLHADSSISENVGFAWPGFKKGIWLSEKQVLNLRCHRITMV
jgi:hypothetical protein